MTPEIIADPEAMRARSRAARVAGLRIGLVPTMGYLHEGHQSLIARARGDCRFVVVSIFVNPTQFAPGEDYDRYPRDLDRDLALCGQAGADVLFHPDAGAMYPRGEDAHRTWVTVEGLSEVLCGSPGSRGSGHFRGVATIVAKLINIVEPDVAYFGQKDAQQAIVISRMARDLFLGARIEVCPTVREPDGLAMSSRNKYLSPAEREAAPVIHRALKAAEEAWAGGERRPGAITDRVRIVLAGEPLFRPEYVEIVSTSTLQPFPAEAATGPALLAVAGRIGGTRLIDNIVLEQDTDRSRRS